ncbi:ATP-binding protein [Microbispora sp. CSR-4]|uniref:ATP-binding protein n=1 Tax=Microbispora sp. CSR-4 TaxID=2592813 RepID=UPI0021C80437|nr:ATP-binding protein [Microbispora sp. CSR-4]
MVTRWEELMEISGDGAGNRVARLAGGRDQVGRARRLVSAALGRGHPRHDDCVLLTSEIATNAVVHSRSGDGGTFTVTVSCLPDRVRICVEDDGSAAPPCAGHPLPNGSSQGGRGLPLLDLLADRWGLVREAGRNEVWFEVWSDGERHAAALTRRWPAARVRPAVAARGAASG